MLNDDDGVACVHEVIEDAEQPAHVAPREPRRRLVENIDLTAPLPRGGGEFTRDLEPLGLSARESVRGLSEAEVAEPDPLKVP